MASIPLPALSVKPPEQPDVLGQYGNLLRLKGLQQGQQLQQQQLANEQQQNQSGALDLQEKQLQIKSQQALMKAYSEAEGDLSKAIPLASKYGATPQDTIKLQQAAYQQRENARKELTEKGDLAVKQADLMSQAHDTVMAAKPEERAAVYQQMIPQLANAGIDMSQVPQQYPGDDQFKMIGMGINAHKHELENLAKEATIAKEQAETAKAKSEAEMGQPLSSETAYISDYLKVNGLPNSPKNRFDARNDYIKKTKVDPGVARVNVLGGFGMEVADPNNPGQTIVVPRNQAAGMAGKGSASVVVPKKEAEYMTSGKGGQQLTAFNTAISHLSTLDRLADDLNNTDVQIVNKAKQAWAQQTGNPAPANFAAAKNAMSGEVASALKASGATDQEIAKVGETFDRAQSPAQLKGAIGTYRELLNSKRDQLKAQHEAAQQGKPNFGQQSGMTRIKASDGSLHDIPSANLDAARKIDPNLQVVQ